MSILQPTTQRHAPGLALEVTVQLFGTLAKGSNASGPHVVRAATVGGAADVLGIVFDRHVTAALNGDQISRDGATPLAAGNAVFLSGDAGEVRSSNICPRRFRGRPAYTAITASGMLAV